MYQARILDKDRQLKAVLPGVRWHYTRRINEATEISIYIPRETIDEHIPQGHALYGFFAPSQPFAVQGKPTRAKPNKAKHAEIAAFIQIYKGDKLKASGKIVGRTLGQVVTVHAMTEEILLETSLTPAQYGKVWDGWDLADVARDLLDGWQTIRVKAPEQWQQYMVDSHRVDLTTEPGTVMLAKRSNGRYYDSGYITLVFNKSEIPHFKSWDRVRWSADSEDPVTTSIQVSTNGVSFSAPFDGGLPEEIGYYIGGDHDQVWVRVNLETTDTESEDANEVPTGVTPTVFAVELIARTEGNLAVGNIPAVAGATVKGLSADHASAFRVLVDACDQVGWEFQVVNGALNIAENLGVDRTKDFVFRAGSNIEITALGDDDGELCNVLTAYSPGQGINRMEITLRDEASITEYGEYPAAVEFEAETLSELQQEAQEYLAEHNTPKTQFEVAVVFEYGQEPDYGIGDKVRVADPDTGIVTTTRIMTESREYNEQGLTVHLELGKAGFTLAEAISGEKRVAKPLDPMQPTGVYARGIVAGIRVGFAEPKMDDWAYSEVHVSTAPHFEPSGGTLRDKGKQTRFDIMELTPGVRYYAKVVHVDNAGRRSEASQEVSAVANYMSPELLPDYSLGVEKFMENLKPPIVVTSLPSLPDPRYTIGTSVFLTTDKKLYSTDGNTWTPVGAGTVTADEIVAGIITAGGIKADWYADIRNVLPYTGQDSLDQDRPIVIPFYIPSETTKIVAAFLSAEARRYRAYSKSAPYDPSAFWDKQTKGTSFNSPAVSVTVNQSNSNTGQTTLDHVHQYSDTHITPSTGGGHTHALTTSSWPKLNTDYSDPDNHRHTFDSFNIPSNSGTHTHSTTNTSKNTEGPRVGAGGLTPSLLSHTHTYDRVTGVQLNNFEAHFHDYDPAHDHKLEFGIHEDTTPSSVRIRINNGSGWSGYITLASAPDATSPYDLIAGASVPKHNGNASEMDLAPYLSGTGWKYIEFSSNRLGLIAWNIILKLDITA